MIHGVGMAGVIVIMGEALTPSTAGAEWSSRSGSTGLAIT
jgi:hypothetical protein